MNTDLEHSVGREAHLRTSQTLGSNNRLAWVRPEPTPRIPPATAGPRGAASEQGRSRETESSYYLSMPQMIGRFNPLTDPTATLIARTTNEVRKNFMGPLSSATELAGSSIRHDGSPLNLGTQKVRIAPAAREQFLVWPDLLHFTLVEHDDAVGVPDGA